VRIRVAPAAHSAQQLNAQVVRLERARPRYARSGVLLQSFRVAANGSGIAVGVAVRPDARAAFGAMAARLRASLPVPLTFGAPHALTLMHRLEDFPPHWAGSRIITVQGTDSCTTGFPMQRRSDGRTFITTADHCDADLGHPVNEQWWDWLGPHDTNHRMGEAWYHTGSVDAAYVRPPNGSVGGVTYDGGVAESHDFSKVVVGVGGNYVGAWYCTSGAWTGVHCSIQTQYSDTEYIPDDGAYVNLWWADQTQGGTAAGEGDSGGPVFSLGSASGTVIAKGSITGGASVYSCVNDNGESDQCSNTVAFVDEQSILNSLGANIVTG
jgi:hypothetical protein